MRSRRARVATTRNTEAPSCATRPPLCRATWGRSWKWSQTLFVSSVSFFGLSSYYYCGIHPFRGGKRQSTNTLLPYSSRSFSYLHFTWGFPFLTTSYFQVVHWFILITVVVAGSGAIYQNCWRGSRWSRKTSGQLGPDYSGATFSFSQKCQECIVLQMEKKFYSFYLSTF